MDNEKVYSIIAKHLKGEASIEEQEQLQLWISDSDDNKKLYKQILKSWKIQKAIIFKPNKGEAWNILKENLLIGKQAKFVGIRLRRAIQIAAMLLILLGIGLLFRPIDSFWGENMLSMETTLEQKNIILDDGTEIFLNRGSTLTYPKEFDGEMRQVKLSGEAFFKVAHNPNKPFIIKTSKTRTRILGTCFNLRAYNGELSEKLTVAEGKVEFSSLENTESVILTPGNVGTYLVGEKSMSKAKVSDLNYKSWMDKIFVFKNQTLKTIVWCLSNAYGVNIEINNPDLENEYITTTFNALDLKDVMDILANTMNFEYSIVGKGKIVIK